MKFFLSLKFPNIILKISKDILEGLSMNQEMTKDQLEQYYERSAQIIDRDSFYSPDLYTKHNVKRGLRNEDGTGVVVGLTEIGDVQAYTFENNKKSHRKEDLFIAE